MKLKVLFIFNAVAALGYGIAFLAVPATLLNLYGASSGPDIELVARLYATELVVIGLLTWLARNAAESEARGAMVLALFLGNMVGVVVSVLGVLLGGMNAVGWSAVAIYSILTLGYGYFQFAK